MPETKPFITVFGGSSPRPEEQPYQEAQRLGALLGKAGYAVLTGGYIGTMEAVSRGAAEAGGHVIGVTCDEIEGWRPVNPNPWIMEERRYPTTRERLFALMTACDAALALPGGVGTLAEIVFMWSQLQTGALSLRPLILIGAGWQDIFNEFYNRMDPYIRTQDKAFLTFAPDVGAAAKLLRANLSASR
jgi:uncharacterized protein (TIGR00730 family)